MGPDVLRLHRWAKVLKDHHVPVLPEVVRRLNGILHGTHLPLEAEIGAGTSFVFGGIGCVIHPEARIGRHCVISQQVTIAARHGMSGAPVVGDYVRIGPGAKVLGPVTIGDFAQIGANTVVVKDVPRGAVVVGVPAKELRIEDDPEASWEREMGRPPPDLGAVH